MNPSFPSVDRMTSAAHTVRQVGQGLTDHSQEIPAAQVGQNRSVEASARVAWKLTVCLSQLGEELTPSTRAD